MNELTVQEAALAWAHGKMVEARPTFPKGAVWSKISPVGVISNQTWPASIFNDQIEREFRLTPVPPAKKWRPWTAEEVPVGAQIRLPAWDDGGRLLICGAWDGNVMWATPAMFTRRSPEVLLEEGWLHSTDHGKTWLPCGVEVEA